MEPYAFGTRRSFRNLFATEDTNVGWGVERLRGSKRSKVQDQEDFLKMMGLQVKRLRTHSSETDDYTRKKKFIIPNNIHLRECSVVISGVVCNICGRSFKCITDLKFHVKLRHQRYTDTSSSGIDTDHNAEDETELCEMCNTTFTSVFDKKIHIKKMHRQKSPKLRLVFKVGTEVITKLSVKRKHLKSPENNVANQPDYTCDINTVPTKDIEQGSDFLDIDLSTCNSRIGTQDFSTVNIANPADRHFGNDISINRVSPINDSVTVNRKQNDSEFSESNVSIDTNILRTSTENLNPNETRSSAPRASVIKKLVASNDATSLERATHLLSNNKPNEHCLENNNNSVAKSDAYSINPTINNTREKQLLDRDIETSRPKESAYNHELSDNQVPQINGFGIHVSKDTCPVSNSLKTLNVVTQSRHENKLAAPKSCQKRLRPATEIFEKTSNEEIQEVLRINRAKRRKDDINHESPNRSEREMLHVLDAIRDMLRMEEKGYHLANQSMIKNNYKRKCSNGNIVNNNEKSSTLSRESSKNVQNNMHITTKSNEQDSYKFRAQTNELENSKENVPKFTQSAISLQELQSYGINYYNDTIEMSSETA